MKHFFLFVGVAAVAGAMYVAGASGSQQAKFASEKQVVALQKKVATLTKQVKGTVAPEANLSAAYILTCLAQINSDNTVTVHLLPVSQRGSVSSGYLFGADSATATPTTALDVDNSSNPAMVLQQFDPACLSGAALRHQAVRTNISRLHGWTAKNSR